MVRDMKFLLRLAVLLMVSVLLLSVMAAPAAARAPFVSADRAGADLVLVQEGDVVTEDLYAAGNRVVVEGTVEGDVLAVATGEVLISGHVLGSVTATASSVVITGTVDGSVRVGAATVRVEGKIGGDLLAGASRVTVTGDIGRDLLAWTLDLDTSVTVGRDVGGQIVNRARIGGTVDGNVDVTVGRIEVLAGTQIGGTLGYRSSADAVISQGVDVGRQIVHRDPVRPNVRLQAIFALTQLITVLTIIIVGFLMFWTAPRILERTVFALRRFPVRTFFVGLATIVVPVLIVGFASALALASSPELALPMVVVGGPIALTVLGMISLGVLLAPVPVLTAVGSRLLGWRRSGQAGFLVGSLLWVISLMIPIVGAIVLLIMAVLGLGAWTVGLVTRHSEAVSEPILPTPSDRSRVERDHGQLSRTDTGRMGPDVADDAFPLPPVGPPAEPPTVSRPGDIGT